MESDKLQKSRLTRADLLRLSLIAPIATIVFIAIFRSTSSIERLAWGTSVSSFDQILVVAFSIGSSILAGSCVAPGRFIKTAACIISAAFFLCMVVVWLTYAKGAHLGLAATVIGIYFALPAVLATKSKSEGRKIRAAHLKFTIYAIIIISIISGLAVIFAINAGLAHYFPDKYSIIFVLMIAYNAIRTAWRWVIDRKITGISLLFSLFGRLWKYLPFGILFSLAMGGDCGGVGARHSL